MSKSPDRYTLVVDHQLFHKGTYIVTLQAETGDIVEQQGFTSQATVLLLALLEHYPDYCPLEVLYAAFYALDVEDAREVIHDAIEEHTLTELLHPLRTMLYLAKPGLRAFVIEVQTVTDTGYILIPQRRVYKNKRE